MERRRSSWLTVPCVAVANAGSGERRERDSISRFDALPELATAANLLRQDPVNQLLDFRVAEPRLRPHYESLAPVAGAPTADDVRQPIPLLRVATVTLRDRAERGTHVGAAQSMAIQTAFLLGEPVALIETIARSRQSQR